ncbi:MAG: PAS domain S-box protein, partial [Deltaproteobacteria bacterium]|nr:PAS domain S-box protein [Deltaproteobacteria bacterium]
MTQKPTYAELEKRVKELEIRAVERKRIEKKLEEKEQTLRALLNAPPESSMLIGLEGKVLAINEVAAQRFGKKIDELIGTVLYDHMPYDLAESRKAQGDKVVRSGKPVYLQDERAGRIYDTNIYPVLNAEEKVTALAIHARDITETKKEEEALRESEEKFKKLFEFAPDGFYLSDLEGNFIDGNKAAQEIIGYKKEELIGSSFLKLDLLLPEELPKVAELLNESVKGRATGPDELILKRKDGTTVVVEIMTLPVTIKNQEVVLGITRDITLRKRTEEALREKEASLASIFRAAPTGIGVVCDRVIQKVNNRLCEITGYLSDELLGKNARILYPTDEDFEYVGREKYIQIRERGTGTVETKWQRKDDKVIDVLLSSTPLDVNDLSAGITFTALDITWGKKVEHELRESEERYKGIFEYTKSGVAVYKAIDEGNDFIFEDFNKKGEIIDNIKKDELIGKSVLEMFPSVKDFGLFDVFQRVWKTGKPEHHPITMYKDQRISGWRDNFVYKLSSGEIVTVYSDETERKQAEETLKESEEKYRLLYENATDAIFIAQDEASKFVNPKAEEMTGYSAEELAKIPFVDIIHPEDRDMVLERHLKRLKGEEFPSIYSFRILNRSGEEISVDLNAVLINWEGRPATLNFIRDITQQKKLEVQLQQAQKMEAIGTLAGGIAHDFNNILMAIIGYAEIMDLFEVPEDSPMKPNLKEVLKAANRAKDLVQQILTF